MFDTHEQAHTHLLETFFPADMFREETILYTNVNIREQFACTVYTFGDAPFVIKQMVDVSSECENGKLRWFPELINHKLAETLLPEHVLTLHAACVNRNFTHFYLVYDRADKLCTKNPNSLFEVVRKLNDRGLFHLDTKPSNFLVRGDRVFIHDFGIALPMEMHACPGGLMFSDPFVSDRDLWDAVRSVSFDGANPYDTIRDFALQCQTRMLYAKIPKKCVPPADVPAHAVGLGLDGLYTSPAWFAEMFTILNSFCTYSILKAWQDFRMKLVR